MTIDNLLEAESAVFDLASLSDVMLFGEDHSASNERQFVSSLLPQLKSKGYSILALEITEGTQEDMNRYLKDEISFDEMILRHPSERFAMHPDYREIMESAKRLAFYIVCMDANDRNGSRNKYMADKIHSGIQQKHSKCVALVGNGHILHRGNTGRVVASGISGHLDDKGISCSAISMERDEYDGPIYQALGKKIDRITAVPKSMLDMHNHRFPFENETYSRLYDCVILFPKQELCSPALAF